MVQSLFFAGRAHWRVEYLGKGQDALPPISAKQCDSYPRFTVSRTG